MFKPSLLALPLLLLLLAPARGEIVHTKRGERLIGEVVTKTQDEVVLKTPYGILIVPTKSIVWIEPNVSRAKRDPFKPRKLHLRIRLLHMKARRLRIRKRHAQAIARYRQILKLAPGDLAALYHTACAQAQLGKNRLALASLRSAALAGFTDFGRALRAPELTRLREEAGFKRLLAERGQLLQTAAKSGPARITARLKRRGAQADYQVLRDGANRLTFLYPKGDVTFEAARAQVGSFSQALRAKLFRAKRLGPLFVVLLAPEDAAVLGKTRRARFDPLDDTLVCAPFPFGQFFRSRSARRQLVRALHHGDRATAPRRQPAWLVEGLTTLLASATVAGGELVLPHSARLTTIQAQKAIPWSSLLELTHSKLNERASSRDQACYLVRYLWKKGCLGKLYARSTQLESAEGRGVLFAKLLGKPIGQVEQDFRTWLQGLPAPTVPFTGMLTSDAFGGLRVSWVQSESGAARANLWEGDTLTAVDGAPVRSKRDLLEALSGRKVGEEIEVEALRRTTPMRVRVALSRRPQGAIGPRRGAAPYLGVAVQPTQGGISIHELTASSPAAKAGLQVGDRVLTLDGAKIPTVRSWLRALRRKSAGARGVLTVERAAKVLTVEVTFAELPPE